MSSESDKNDWNKEKLEAQHACQFTRAMFHEYVVQSPVVQDELQELADEAYLTISALLCGIEKAKPKRCDFKSAQIDVDVIDVDVDESESQYYGCALSSVEVRDIEIEPPGQNGHRLMLRGRHGLVIHQPGKRPGWLRRVLHRNFLGIEYEDIPGNE